MKRSFVRLGAILATLLLALYLLSPWIFASLGAALVSDQPPQKADAVLVLAGDSIGHRILKGADLVRQGFAPVAYVSGPRGVYGHTEDELAIAFAVKHGYPAQSFVGLPNRADSTLDEAHMLLPILRTRGVHRLLLVTSNFHTARAGRIFRRIDPQMEVITVAATDNSFSANGWWGNRQGQKTFFFEVSKTIADAVGL